MRNKKGWKKDPDRFLNGHKASVNSPTELLIECSRRGEHIKESLIAECFVLIAFTP